jgi:hypothetical protein
VREKMMGLKSMGRGVEGGENRKVEDARDPKRQ